MELSLREDRRLKPKPKPIEPGSGRLGAVPPQQAARAREPISRASLSRARLSEARRMPAGSECTAAAS